MTLGKGEVYCIRRTKQNRTRGFFFSIYVTLKEITTLEVLTLYLAVFNQTKFLGQQCLESTQYNNV